MCASGRWKSLCWSLQVVQGRTAASKEEAASGDVVVGAGNAAELGEETVGTLDLGGSSLEVTFLPTGQPTAVATSELQESSLSSIPSSPCIQTNSVLECSACSGA